MFNSTSKYFPNSANELTCHPLCDESISHILFIPFSLVVLWLFENSSVCLSILYIPEFLLLFAVLTPQELLIVPGPLVSMPRPHPTGVFKPRPHLDNVIVVKNVVSLSSTLLCLSQHRRLHSIKNLTIDNTTSRRLPVVYVF